MWEHDLRFDGDFDGEFDSEFDDLNEGAQRPTPGKKTRSQARYGHLPAMDPEIDELVARAQASPSIPLPPDLARQMGVALGTDLSGVRVHTSAESEAAAEALSAEAFTVGQHIHFGCGCFEPCSHAGRKLLAHEVAHAAQNRRVPRADGGLEIAPADSAAEAEADDAALAMLIGNRVGPMKHAPAKPMLMRKEKKGDKKRKPESNTASRKIKTGKVQIAITRSGRSAELKLVLTISLQGTAKVPSSLDQDAANKYVSKMLSGAGLEGADDKNMIVNIGDKVLDLRLGDAALSQPEPVVAKASLLKRKNIELVLGDAKVKAKASVSAVLTITPGREQVATQYGPASDNDISMSFAGATSKVTVGEAVKGAKALAAIDVSRAVGRNQMRVSGNVSVRGTARFQGGDAASRVAGLGAVIKDAIEKSATAGASELTLSVGGLPLVIALSGNAASQRSPWTATVKLPNKDRKAKMTFGRAAFEATRYGVDLKVEITPDAAVVASATDVPRKADLSAKIGDTPLSTKVGSTAKIKDKRRKKVPFTVHIAKDGAKLTLGGSMLVSGNVQLPGVDADAGVDTFVADATKALEATRFAVRAVGGALEVVADDFGGHRFELSLGASLLSRKGEFRVAAAVRPGTKKKRAAMRFGAIAVDDAKATLDVSIQVEPRGTQQQDSELDGNDAALSYAGKEVRFAGKGATGALIDLAVIERAKKLFAHFHALRAAGGGEGANITRKDEEAEAFLRWAGTKFGSPNAVCDFYEKMEILKIHDHPLILHEDAAARLAKVRDEMGEAMPKINIGFRLPRSLDGSLKGASGYRHNIGYAVDIPAFRANPHIKDPRNIALIYAVTNTLIRYESETGNPFSMVHAKVKAMGERVAAGEPLTKDDEEWLETVEKKTRDIGEASKAFTSAGIDVGAIEKLRAEWERDGMTVETMTPDFKSRFEKATAPWRRAVKNVEDVPAELKKAMAELEASLDDPEYVFYRYKPKNGARVKTTDYGTANPGPLQLADKGFAQYTQPGAKITPELVVALAKHGWMGGTAFKSADLHHFQLHDDATG